MYLEISSTGSGKTAQLLYEPRDFLRVDNHIAVVVSDNMRSAELIAKEASNEIADRIIRVIPSHTMHTAVPIKPAVVRYFVDNFDCIDPMYLKGVDNGYYCTTPARKRNTQESQYDFMETLIASNGGNYVSYLTAQSGEATQKRINEIGRAAYDLKYRLIWK